MALSGVEIFKYLPKTNCKKCGFPTCLAFAMKLAAKQVSLDMCPDVSDEAKKVLGEASAPPIASITIGVGEKAVKIGEELALFRHEKKFFNPSPFALRISDNMSDGEIQERKAQIKSSEIDRVGQKLRMEMALIANDSGDAGKFETAVKNFAGEKDIPLILVSSNPSAIEKAIAHVKDLKPLIGSADSSNFAEMAAIAKANGASLIVSGNTLDEVCDLTEKIKGIGVNDMVLAPASKNMGEMLRNFTMLRRAAIKKSFKPAGYPVIAFAEREDSLLEAVSASLAVLKYGSIVVLNSIEKWKNLALLTLRQNIYTDPQVPMQVEQNIYKVGEPDENSPVIITTNFSLTYFIAKGEIENSKVPTWLLIMNVEGLSVLTAWAAGKFIPSKIATFIKESGIEEKVKHRKIIIPGYVAVISGGLEDKLGDWKVTVGPREANVLPTYLKNYIAGN